MNNEHPYKEYMEPLTPLTKNDSIDSLNSSTSTKWRSRSVPIKKDDDKILQVNVTVNCNCEKKKESPKKPQQREFFFNCPYCKHRLKYTVPN